MQEFIIYNCDPDSGIVTDCFTIADQDEAQSFIGDPAYHVVAREHAPAHIKPIQAHGNGIITNIIPEDRQGHDFI